MPEFNRYIKCRRHFQMNLSMNVFFNKISLKLVAEGPIDKWASIDSGDSLVPPLP